MVGFSLSRLSCATIEHMIWFAYAILSAFLASLSSIIEKRSLGKIHSTDFSVGVAFLLAVMSIPMFFLYPLSSLTWEVLLATYAASILATVAFLEVTKGVRHMEISESAPLFLLSPFLTAIFAFIILGEELTLNQFFGMGLLAFGTYVLETKRLTDVRGFIQHFIGDQYARLIVLGMFLYAFTSIIDRMILSKWGVPPILYTATIQIFIFFNFIVIAAWKHRTVYSTIELFRTHWIVLLLVAILTFGYRAAFAMAVALTSVALVISIKRTSALFTTIVGGELFHDHNIMRKSIACTIMIGGVFLMSFFK